MAACGAKTKDLIGRQWKEQKSDLFLKGETNFENWPIIIWIMTELVADYPQPEYQISLPSVSSFGQETHLNQTQTQNNGGQPEVLGQTYDTQVNYRHFTGYFCTI